MLHTGQKPSLITISSFGSCKGFAHHTLIPGRGIVGSLTVPEKRLSRCSMLGTAFGLLAENRVLGGRSSSGQSGVCERMSIACETLRK